MKNNKIKDATFKEIFIFILCIIAIIFGFFHMDIGFEILNKLIKVIQPFLVGGCIAFILNIPYNLYLKLFKNNKFYALICTLLTLALLIGLFLRILIPQVIDNMLVLINHFDIYKETTINIIKEIFKDFGLSSDLVNSIVNSIYSISNQFINILNSLVPKIFNIFSNIASYITRLLFSILIAFYLLIFKDKLINQYQRILNVYISENKVKTIMYYIELISNTFKNFINSQIIESFIIGCLCYIGCSLLNIEYASIVSLIIGITNIVPIFGAITGTLLSTLLITFTNPIQGLIFLIFGITLQQIESNLIYPHVVGSSVGLPPLWVLFAVTVGGGLFGVSGMLFGLPIFSIIYEIIRQNFIIKENSINKK